LNPSGPKSGFAVLRNRDFTLFLGARFFSAIASQMIVIAVGWQVYQMTGRLLDLGLIGLSQFLPFLCLVLFAGHAADRHDRRVILIFCGLVQFLCASLLLCFALGRLSHTWPIFLVLAFLGVARAFQMPTSQSLMPNLVPLDALQNAIALNSSMFQVATIAGPSVGGILYAFADQPFGIHGGAALVYSVGAAVCLAAVAMLAVMRLRRAAAKPLDTSWSSVLQGLRFVWRRKDVLGAITLDLFAVLFGGATALLPAFTHDVLHAGPEVFGYLRTAHCARRRRRPHGRAARVSPDRTTRRHLHVSRRRGIRSVHGGIRSDDEFLGCSDRAHRAGRRRHGERVHPHDARAIGDARRDSRACQRG
jgi:MFS family permease